MKRILLTLIFIFTVAFQLTGSAVDAQQPTPTPYDPEATISALQTQVATLEAGSVTSTPQASPLRGNGTLSDDEETYFESVAEALDFVDDIRDRWGSFLDGPVQIQLSQWQLGARGEVLSWILVPSLLPQTAPSSRLQPFHTALSKGFQGIADAGSAYSDAVDAENIDDFNNATPIYEAALENIDSALNQLQDIGLDDDFELVRNPPAAEGTHNVTGTITLFDSDASWFTGVCSGDGGYSDLTLGAQVVVRDESGTVLSIGSLGLGKTASSTMCVFEFELRDVPEARFYSLSLGRREGPTYSYDDLDASGWKVDLSIGS